MSNFVLAPAEKLEASYDGQTLTLYAQGEAPSWLAGFSFRRTVWLGGLRYDFNAWSGTSVPDLKPFKYQEEFALPDLKRIAPDNKVIIVTENHPEGVKVPVNWLDQDSKDSGANGSVNGILKKAAPSTSRDTESGIAQPNFIDPPPIKISSLYGIPFTISEPVFESLGGDIKEVHNPNNLIIETAGLARGNLNWTYNSLMTGPTQVIIETTSPLTINPPHVIRQVYNIEIFVLDNALNASTILSGKPKEIDQILEFVGRVFIAQRIVQATDPSARLIGVKATHRAPYPVTDPNLLSHLVCSFQTATGTATIASTGWGEFGPPVFTESPVIIGIASFDITSCIDIMVAVDAMRAAGIDQAFFWAELDQVLGTPEKAEVKQPYYQFHMVDVSAVFVGAKDKSVRVQPAGLKILPGKGSSKASEV